MVSVKLQYSWHFYIWLINSTVFIWYKQTNQNSDFMALVSTISSDPLLTDMNHDYMFWLKLSINQANYRYF
jgi:hypothetical protein